MFGWNNKWEFIERISEKDYCKEIYDIFKDTNKNGLVRYKKILVNSTGECFNTNKSLLIKKD